MAFEFRTPGNGIDFGLCVATGQVFRWKRVGERWRGSIGRAWFEVTQCEHAPRPGGPWLEVRSNREEAEFVRIFGTDQDDKSWFREILSADPGLVGAIGECRGLRLIRQDDPIEVLFGFICSANNHVRRIEGMVSHLAGYGMEGAFPTLNELARIDPVALRHFGFGYRSERIPLAASTALDRGGVDWLNGLKSASPDVAIAELQGLPGVGPKVAECVALFGLGHGEVVPIDTHIWNAVRRRYLPHLEGGSLTVARRRQVAEFMADRFGKEAGLAHLVLFVDELRNWRSRRDAPQPGR